MDDELFEQWLAGFIIVGGEAWTPEEWAMRPKLRRRPKARSEQERLERVRASNREHMGRVRARRREGAAYGG